MLASSLRLSCAEDVWRTTNFHCTCIHNTVHSIAAIRVMVLVHMSRCDPLVPRRLSMPIQTHLLPPLVALVEAHSFIIYLSIHPDFTSLSSLYDLHTNVLSLRLRTARVVTSVVALRFPIGKRPLAAPKQHPPCNTSSLKHPLCAPLHPFLCLQPVYARHCRHRWRTMHQCKSACGKRASTNDQSTAVVVP